MYLPPGHIQDVENFCMKSVMFDVMEVSLPFNAILGRPALYQFMAVAHYVYLALKLPSPNMSKSSTETARLSSLH
jgi:hypothetical protein